MKYLHTFKASEVTYLDVIGLAHAFNDYSWKYSTGQKTVFTRSAITPPKVNRFG